MKIVLMLLMSFLLCSVVWAEQRYNPFKNKWETVPNNSNWQLRYNTFNNDWTYQPNDAKIEYNAFENIWSWSSGHGNDEEN